MLINPDHYVRIGTAADIVGVTRAYIRRLIHEEKLAGVLLDGIYIVRRDDADDLRKSRVKPSPKKKN